MNKFEFADRASNVPRKPVTRRLSESSARPSPEIEDNLYPTDTVDDYSSTHRPKGQTYGSERDEAPLPDNPAPLSSALGVPTLLKEPPHERDAQPQPDNPAPLSSALGLPTLLKDPTHERDPHA